jgi:hypothetical protein
MEEPRNKDKEPFQDLGILKQVLENTGILEQDGRRKLFRTKAP